MDTAAPPPPLHGAIGSLTGWPIFTSAVVPWMRPLQLPLARTIVAREAADVEARIRWEQIKVAMRLDLERALADMAARVGVRR